MAGPLSILKEYFGTIRERESPVDYKLHVIVAAQMVLCFMCFVFCVVTMYTHNHKGLFCLLAAVTITVGTSIMGRSYRNSRNAVAGLMLIIVVVAYALMHIMTRQWYFPLFFDDLHNYPFK